MHKLDYDYCFLMAFMTKKMLQLSLVFSCRCAGVCSYEGRGGLCSIRLSEPLLKLRPRKDLVEVGRGL